MARYWATSGWTRLSICVLLDGSISSLRWAPRSRQHCADSSMNVTQLRVTQSVWEWAAVAWSRAVTHSLQPLSSTRRDHLRQKSWSYRVFTLQLWINNYFGWYPFHGKIQLNERQLIHVLWFHSFETLKSIEKNIALMLIIFESPKL